MLDRPPRGPALAQCPCTARHRTRLRAPADELLPPPAWPGWSRWRTIQVLGCLQAVGYHMLDRVPGLLPHLAFSWVIEAAMQSRRIRARRPSLGVGPRPQESSSGLV